MIDILKFSIGFLACGFVSSGALWSFIDAAASTKYICTESSDSHILASRVLDWFQAATAIWTLYLVYIHYRVSTKPKTTPDNAFSIIALGVYTVVHILVHVSLRGHVCQHVGCVTSKSAELARTGISNVPYINEVFSMLDLTTPTYSGWPCMSRINPDYFTMPRSSCPETIAEICQSAVWSPQNAPAQAYRCMIYACNDLVPGNVRRYTMSMLGLVMQLVICAYLFSVEEGNEYNAVPVGDGAVEMTDQSSGVEYAKIVNSPKGGGSVPVATEAPETNTFHASGVRRRTTLTSHFRPKETLQF